MKFTYETKPAERECVAYIDEVDLVTITEMEEL